MTLRETAIQWFFRLKKIDMEHPERTQFETWLMQSTAHQKAYMEVENLWSKLDSTASVNELTFVLDKQKKKGVQRFKTSASVLGIVLAITTSLFGYRAWQAQPVMQMTASTAVGEVLTQALEDGSKIVMSANSDVEVVYYRNHREVNLKRGEVIFEVTSDKDRPFIVDSGKAKVTVLGTKFAVNRLQRLVRISVDHGRVKVQALHLNQNENDANQGIILSDGQVAEVINDSMPKRVDRSASDAFGFATGNISFRDAGLDEVAETLSRYRSQPIEAHTGGSQQAHVTAFIKTDNVETFITKLPKMAPVTIKTEQGKTILQAVTK